MASELKIDVRSNLAELTRGMRGAVRDQVPFASALALTDVASRLAKLETSAMTETFDRPTPFTLKAMGVKPAKKTDLTAAVFVKDTQARYLDPYLSPAGGRQVLGRNRAILMPIDVARNQYGNIPRGALRSLKGRPDVFVGSIKTREGEVYGVWQRPLKVSAKGHGKAVRLANRSGHLQLLIRFTTPAPVGPNLRFEARARAFVDHQLPKSFDAALTRALATAR